MKNNLASFTPVTITAETLQILSKQPDYANLLALYMAYVEITTWQNTNSIKASREFMVKRLSWHKTKISKYTKQLKNLGLIEATKRKDKKNTITGHYILIKHIITPSESHAPTFPDGGFSQTLAFGPTSTINLNKSTINLNKNAGGAKAPSHQKEKELLELVNRIIGRAFRVLPERGTKKLLNLFTLEEIEIALEALAADDWHIDKLQEFKIDYLIRSTTIDKFLAIGKPKRDPRVFG